MKKLLLVLVLVFAWQGGRAQKAYQPFSIGAGIGQNYGGKGVNFSYAPVKRFAFVGHFGTNGLDYNYGGGANMYLLFSKKRKLRPNIKALYGYTTLIDQASAGVYHKTYYGFTLGVGTEVRFGKRKAYGFDVDVLFPFKSDDYKAAVAALSADPVTGFTENFPALALAFSLHVDFGKGVKKAAKAAKPAE